MARVSLILPTSPGQPPIPSRIDAWRLGLERAGHEAEVLVCGLDVPGGAPAWRGVVADGPGLAAAAIAGLRQARGDVLLVLDPARHEAPAEDLARVVEPLAAGRAELAVATRGIRGPDGVLGPRVGPVPVVARLLTGTTAPRSGLIGLTRAALDGVRDDFQPAGGTIAFELLARVRGRWVEVPVGPPAPGRPWWPGIDDLRQWKRLADHRFGNASRLIQFCAVGGSGMVVDLTCYFAFQPLLARQPMLAWNIPPTRISCALALSRALAIAVALVWNFSLNRRLTFSYARTGSVGRQFVTYVLSNALGIVLSLGLSLGLPRKVAFFNAHKLAAAVVGIVAATGVSFSMSRWVVFRRRDAGPTPGGPGLSRPAARPAQLRRGPDRVGSAAEPAGGRV